MADMEKLLVAIVKRQSAGERLQMPEGGQLLWQWFCDLHGARTWNANGPNPISYGEIAIYRDLAGWPMEERHIQILRAMDEAWVADFYKRQNGPEKGDKPLPAPSGRPMTPALFDAMFG